MRQFFWGAKQYICLFQKVSFSYKRGCKCVNISLMVQKILQNFHLRDTAGYFFKKKLKIPFSLDNTIGT